MIRDIGVIRAIADSSGWYQTRTREHPGLRYQAPKASNGSGAMRARTARGRAGRGG